MIRLTPHHPSMPQWVISLYRSFGEPLLAKRYWRTAFGRRFAALRGAIWGCTVSRSRGVVSCGHRQGNAAGEGFSGRLLRKERPHLCFGGYGIRGLAEAYRF